MNILVCDDKQSEIDKFVRLIGDSNVNVHTVSFNSGYDVLVYINTGAFALRAFAAPRARPEKGHPLFSRFWQGQKVDETPDVSISTPLQARI